jgi:hypothetical protein
MEHEIALHDKETALKIANILVDEDYVVMISREENLYIINYLYAQYSDRNDVVFMNRDEFDTDYYRITEEE